MRAAQGGAQRQRAAGRMIRHACVECDASIVLLICHVGDAEYLQFVDVDVDNISSEFLI